jgi:hypothetical protein
LPTRKSCVASGQRKAPESNRFAEATDIKKALIERFLHFDSLTLVRAGLLSMLVNTPLLLKVRVSVCWVTFMPRLLTENIEPGVGAERIRHHRGTQSISNLLLRHADTDFCYIVGAR